MNFKKILAILLPVLVTSTIVGVGFSSWYFKKDNLEVKNQASIYVVSDVTKGDIEIIQYPSMLIFSEGFGRKDDLTDGIDFYTEDNSSYTQNDRVILKYKIKDSNDSISGNKFRLFVTISEDIFAKYISLTSTYSNANSVDGYDFSKYIDTSHSTDESDPYYLYTLRMNNVIQYKNSDKKPTTKSAYQDLCSSLKNASITIKFVVI